MIAQAQERVDVLKAQRDGIASALLGARRLLDQACPALDPLPGERDLADGLVAL
jgi:hypothetical protein